MKLEWYYNSTGLNFAAIGDQPGHSFKAALLWPSIKAGNESDAFLDPRYVVRLRAPTGFEFVYEPQFWYGEIRVLGFGFMVSRQTGY